MSGRVPVTAEVVFFDSDGCDLSIDHFDSFFVFGVIHGTVNSQSFARRRVTKFTIAAKSDKERPRQF